MNKSELVAACAEKSGLAKKDVEKVIVAGLEAIKEELVKGGKVQLIGFGTFETRERAARKGINPQNPEKPIDIPASTVPAFKPGKGFKEVVNAKNVAKAAKKGKKAAKK